MPMRTGAILGLCVALFAIPARGDDDARARSRELNAEATRAMDAHDLPRALERYHAAYDAFPSPKLHFNLGLVLDKLGSRAEAADELQAFLDEVPDAPADAQKFARERVAALRVLLGHVTVRCVVPTSIVRLDQRAKPCDKPRYVEPGDHALEVTAEGYEPMKRTLAVPRGELAVEAGLVPRSVTPPSAIEAPVVTPPPPASGELRHGGPSYAAPIALAVVSGAVFATGLGLYLDASHTHGEYMCSDATVATGARCNTSKHFYWAGDALLATGSVGLAIDIVLWAVDAHARKVARRR